MIELMLNMH